MINCNKMYCALDGAQAIVRTIESAQDAKVIAPLEQSLRIMLESALEQVPSDSGPQPPDDEEDE